MNLGKITVITPPDQLFNLNISYLLINPSQHVAQQFQTILSRTDEDVNVFMYDTNENDIGWLLGVAHQVDIKIIDVDNCTPTTKAFVTFLLAHPNTYYITNDELTPYSLISKNRIYDLDEIVKQILQDEDDDNAED